MNSLISRIQKGDEGAFSDLTLQYRPLIESMVLSFRKKGEELLLSKDDIMQEATLAFYSAACAYDTNSPVTFGLYAKICIRNKLISMLRASSTKKKEKNRGVENVSQDPVDRLLEKEKSQQLGKKIESALSGFELSVFRLYLEKKSYAEIAEELGRSVKSVDNAIFRIKTKLKRFM